MSSKLDPICPSIDFCPTRYSGSALWSEGFVQDKSHTRVAKSPLALVTLHLGQKGQKPIKNSSVFGFRPFVLLSTRAQELTINPPPLSFCPYVHAPARNTRARAYTCIHTTPLDKRTKGQKSFSFLCHLNQEMPMRQCDRCRYYSANPPSAMQEIIISADGVRGGGECRFNPPSIVYPTDQIAKFPIVFHDSWCGRFEEREHGSNLRSAPC